MRRLVLMFSVSLLEKGKGRKLLLRVSSAHFYHFAWKQFGISKVVT